MKDSVIIIESPNKVEKIKQLTGAEVYATIGHFTNLIGVDIENNFACKFEIKEDKAKKINFLKPPKQKSQISLVFGMNALVPLGTI
ncbi:hypothetical protein KH0155_27110 [Helicobacter pylori]